MTLKVKRKKKGWFRNKEPAKWILYDSANKRQTNYFTY